jgi:hypothetical protein
VGVGVGGLGLNDPEVLGEGNGSGRVIDRVIHHLAHTIEPKGRAAGATLPAVRGSADGFGRETEF